MAKSRRPRTVDRTKARVKMDPALARALELLRQGRPVEAERIADRAVAARPRDGAAARVKGLAAMQRGRYEEAETWLTRAGKLDPRNPAAFLDRASVHRYRGRYEDMIASAREALRIRPGLRPAEVMLARALESAGRPEAALEQIRKIGARRSLDPDLGDVLVTVLDLLGRDEEALDAATGLLAASGVPAPIRRSVGLRRGRILERRGDLDGALAAWEAAQGEIAVAFDPDAFDRRLDEVAEATTIDGTSSFQTPSDAVIPILIAAMPRSGTSLLERMIAVGSGVVGIGEAPVATQVIRDHREELGEDSMMGLLTADPAMLERLRGDLRRRLAGLAPRATHAVSKHLQNWLQLPTYARLAPEAPIVRLHRDPVAVGVSIYGQDLPVDRMPWATRLEWIGRVVSAERRFTERMRSIVPNPWIDLPFEEVLGDPEATMRRVFDGIGLPFDEACLAHQESEAGGSRPGRRFMPTLSLHQVRRPIDPALGTRGDAWAGRLDALRRGMGD
ncbi:MAG: sulfotransferase [Planctomycetota bacterium]|nr:sulfotransferase [Planctomycetota bacterium]